MRLTGLKAATNNSVVQSTISRDMFYHRLFTRFSLSVVSDLLVCGIRRNCRMGGGGREREGGGRGGGGGRMRDRAGRKTESGRHKGQERNGDTKTDRRRAAMDGKRERERSVKARAERHCRIVSNPSLGQFRRAKCVQCTHQVNTVPVVQKRYVEKINENRCAFLFLTVQDV